MTATRPERAVVITELIEARTRRLMADRARLPEWGDGRRERKNALPDIDASLDEWNDLAK